MDIQTRILTLASKKISKEATRKELAELKRLLLENPEINASLKYIFATWDIINFEPRLSDKEIDGNLADVLKKIHDRIQAPEKEADTSAGEN